MPTKQVEFKALQEDAKHKEETARNETELVRRKLELEQMEVKKQVEITRAKLMGYGEVKESKDDVGSIEDYDLLHMPQTQTSHEKTPEENKPENLVQIALITFAQFCTSTSTIVPVWLSVSSRPDKKLSVFTILDTQSGATLTLEETCDFLGAAKELTKLATVL